MFEKIMLEWIDILEGLAISALDSDHPEEQIRIIFNGLKKTFVYELHKPIDLTAVYDPKYPQG